MRKTTVAMNPSPKAMATRRRRFFSMITSPKCPDTEDIISDVISRIMAVAASQRLISDIDIGKFMFSLPIYDIEPQSFARQ